MTTPAHRRSELAVLLEQMRRNPSRDWTGVKDRAFILGRLLARDTRGAADLAERNQAVLRTAARN